MIPRILHQTAKTAEIPKKWREFQARARSLHPDWEYRLWTDEDNLALVAGTSDHLLSFYKGLPRNIMRADLVRYLILERFGGMYFDFDYEFFKPFDLLQENIVLPRESDDEEEVYLGNCIMASEPRHPFWACALAELEKGMAALGRDPLEDEIPLLTGPGLMTRSYGICPGARRTYVRPTAAAVPPSDASQQRGVPCASERRNLLRGPSCDGTWRANTLAQRVGRRISRLRSELRGSGHAGQGAR